MIWNRVMRAFATILLGTALVSAGSTDAASAAPGAWTYDQNQYTEEIDDLCGVAGLDVHVDGQASSRFRVTTRNGLSYGQVVERVTQIWTTESGGYMRSEVQFQSGDKKVTLHGDGTYTLEGVFTGTFVVYNEAGKRIGTSAGLMKYSLLLDDAGTPTDMSDDELVGDYPDPIKDVGKEFDFCTTAVEQLT